MQRVPKQGEIYQHFKGMLYQIIAVATHSETREQMVVYQALYGDFKTYVRPLVMFVSEVERDKYPKVVQKYRFELRKTQEGALSTEETTEKTTGENAREINEKISEKVSEKIVKNINVEITKSENKIDGKEAMQSIDRIEEQNQGTEVVEETVNSILLEFLDAQSYSKKMDVLSSNIKHLNDRLINDMAISIDCTIDEGALDRRIQSLMNCLQAMCRFEDRRLR